MPHKLPQFFRTALGNQPLPFNADTGTHPFRYFQDVGRDKNGGTLHRAISWSTFFQQAGTGRIQAHCRFIQQDDTR